MFTASSTWQSTARTLLFNCIDTQFYNDGTQDEESPGYAGDLLIDILQLKLLDQDDGHAAAWTSTINSKVKNGVTAFYQLLTPNGDRPALGDTYRSNGTPMFLRADLVEGMTLPVAEPRVALRHRCRESVPGRSGESAAGRSRTHRRADRFRRLHHAIRLRRQRSSSHFHHRPQRRQSRAFR
jgi:hypothetical protein